MNANDITNAIIRDRWRRNFCLPRYTPAGWWECDVFELTAAGFFCEYEIKVSVADFRADAAKQQVKYLGWNAEERRSERSIERKHDLLAALSTRGPSRFWYVTPAGMLAMADLPEWAGLIEMDDRGSGYGLWRLQARIVRQAPQLHREKCPEKVRQNASAACYYRMHDLMMARAKAAAV